MIDTGKIRIEEYNYPLSEDKIAKYPLPDRDSSKLLYLNDSIPEARLFSELPDLLPDKSLLLFNITKVVNARLLFKKETGAVIEVFCLEPVEPVTDFQLAFEQRSPVVWRCLVGNAKRWKSGKLDLPIVLQGKKIILSAEKVEKLEEGFLIKFFWNNDSFSFSEVIDHTGMIPIPPYLKRKADESDKARYQTIYAENEGSVAAPTAGLHFTKSTFTALRKKGIETDELTLHVGAGTFKPVVSDQISDHEMHVEKVVININTLKHILKKIVDPVIPVGTTSMRTLESLYWMALKLKKGDSSFMVNQWDPYHNDDDISSEDAIKILIEYLENNSLSEIKGETRLMIAPGYKFRFASGLITNFHQPKSTLLLLVSALIGENWKLAYDFALNNDFRFLSYGDSCLFLPLKLKTT